MAQESDADRAVFRYVPRQRLWTTENFASGVLSRLQDHSAAIHLPENVILVTGGRATNAAENPYSRWHSIDLGASRVSAFTAPDRLFGATTAYDPSPPRFLVFGGNKGELRLSDSLWQLDLSNGFANMRAMTLRPRGERPPARYYHASVYDPVRRWLIVYGGLGSNGQPLNEGRTWLFDTSAGQWLAIDGAWVGERYGAVMVYDTHHQTAILVAGAARHDRDVRGSVYYLACPGVPVPETATPAAGETPTGPPTGTATAGASETAAVVATETATEALSPTLAPTASATATASSQPSPAASGTTSPLPRTVPPPGAAPIYFPQLMDG